jgi:hypothetical protein
MEAAPPASSRWERAGVSGGPAIAAEPRFDAKGTCGVVAN